MKFEPEKGQSGRNIQFHDPNPVTEPIGTATASPEPVVPEPELERPATPSNPTTKALLDENEF